MVSKIALQLYRYGKEVVNAIEDEASVICSSSGEIPIVDPQHSDLLVKKFEPVLDIAGNETLRRSDTERKDFELDVITDMFSLRVQELHKSIDEIQFLSSVDTESAWADPELKANFSNVIALVSIAGGINSSRGTGRVGNNAVNKFFLENEEVICTAFVARDEPVYEFLTRVHNSDLGQFGGAILAIANARDSFEFEAQRLAHFDRYPGTALPDYSDFTAFSLEALDREQFELPQDFWKAYFDAVYGSGNGTQGLLVPGTYDWAKQAQATDLYDRLAQRYPNFSSEMLAHIQIDAAANAQSNTPGKTQTPKPNPGFSPDR